MSIIEIRAYARGELSAVEAGEFERHVMACPACREEVRSFLGVRAALSTGTQKPLRTCLSTDEILQLVGAGDLEGQPKAVEHLISCADCREGLAAAREEWGSPLPEAPQSCLDAVMTAVANLHASDRPKTVPSRRTVSIPWLAAAACLALVLGVFFIARILHEQTYVRVVLCQGEVTVQQANEETRKVAAGDKVVFGCTIGTSAGAVCQMKYPGGLQVSLREHSRFHLVGRGRGELGRGTVYVDGGGRDQIEVSTPQGSVTARNAGFTLSAYEGKALVQVLEGKVLFKNACGSQRVGRLAESMAVAGQSPGIPCPTTPARIWRIENHHPEPVFKWVVLDRFESLNGLWTYAPDAEGRIGLNAGMPKEGKACVEIHRLASDRGPTGLWREITLPPEADRLRLWIFKKSSCPMAILSIQLRAAADTAGQFNCYHMPLWDLPAGRWALRELDLKRDVCVPDDTLLQPSMVKALSIICSGGPADVLVDDLECRVAERR